MYYDSVYFGNLLRLGTALSSIGDGGVHNGGGSFANVGFTTGLILPFLDRAFVGLHKLLRVQINYSACGYFNTRATVRLQFPFTDMT